MTIPRPLQIAIQGERGAFSEQAAQKLLDVAIRTIPTRDFPHMFSSVARQKAHLCLAPMENSLVGSIYQNYDLLLSFGFRVFGEVYLKVEHCLIAPVGTYFEDVRRVYSHPIALDQCQEFFRLNPRIESVSTWDTAGSVQLLIDRREEGAAAIAGKGAATAYGAKVLAEGIEDDPANYTRFFLLGRPDSELTTLEERLRSSAISEPKTALVFYLENEPGALHAALGEFADRGIDLARVESRPVRGKPFEYLFYLDVLGTPRKGPVREALAALRKRSGFLRILGTFPAGRLDWVGERAALLPRGTSGPSERRGIRVDESK